MTTWSQYSLKLSRLSGRKRPLKKPPAILDQVKSGICASAYQARSSWLPGPLMLMQPSQGTLTWSARLKLGLLARKGCALLAAAQALASCMRSMDQLEPP